MLPDLIARLWQEHQRAAFPDACAGEEIEGIELAELDGTAAGCICSFVDHDGQLDLWRTAILGLCARELAIVVRNLANPARDYFARLERLTGAVLEAVRDAARPS